MGEAAMTSSQNSNITGIASWRLSPNEDRLVHALFHPRAVSAGVAGRSSDS